MSKIKFALISITVLYPMFAHAGKDNNSPADDRIRSGITNIGRGAAISSAAMTLKGVEKEDWKGTPFVGTAARITSPPLATVGNGWTLYGLGETIIGVIQKIAENHNQNKSKN